MFPTSLSKVFGFEEYKLYEFPDCVLDGDPKSTWVLRLWGYEGGTRIILENLPIQLQRGMYGEVIANSLYENHKELLDKPESLVYVHPACKIPRTLLFTKYKRCLNPWAADIVVVPKPSVEGCHIDDYALFVSDAVAVSLKLYDNKAKAESFKEGTRLGDITHAFDNFAEDYNTQELYDTELAYVGEMLHIPSGNLLLDIITGSLPVDKTVFEETIQASLGDESNKITFDSLKSIGEMLSSSDENTVSAALKALSMMDYMHYPNSVKLMLYSIPSYNYKYNNAMNSTSVRFMIKQLYGTVRKSRMHIRYDREIYEDDYILFRQLLAYYDDVPEDSINDRIVSYPFVVVNSEGLMCPKLRAA